MHDDPLGRPETPRPAVPGNEAAHSSPAADPASDSDDALRHIARDAVYATVLRNLPDTTVFVFGPDLRCLLVEGGGFRQGGWSTEDLIGRRPTELVGDVEAARQLEEAMRAALAGETRVIETRGMRSADSQWVSTASPLTSPTGQIEGGLLVSRNLAPLRRAEAERVQSLRDVERWSAAAQRERRLRQRLEFLAGIDSVLAGCRDRIEIMRAVVGAAVPRLGDWCSIHVLMDSRDRLPVVEVSHVDPAMVEVAREVIERFPYDPDDPFGIAMVIRTGEPVLLTDLDPAALEAAMPDPSGGQAIRRLGLTSTLIVPVSVGGATFGALTFSVTGGKRQLDDDDLALAQALAGRVGVSLENRRLGEVEREIAATLQRSLLPARLPELPNCQVAVRYWAAGEGTEVGGDFYDVFDTGHGAHAVVIGDVCGNGPAAAAVTATVRHTIRALARHGDDHASVLHHLNDAVISSWPEIFCTVTYATLEPSGTGMKLVAVSGGHPLPILVRADGKVSRAGRAGMLIGAFDIPPPEPFAADLSPGDTIVFYTDGAYDLPPPRFVSDDDLLELVAGAVRQADDAETVADGIAHRLEVEVPFGERDDDVALVVVRVVPTGAQE